MSVLFKSPIARKLIIYIFVVSSAITLILTALQLYRDYKYDLQDIQNRFDHIKISNAATLSSNLWVVNYPAVQLTLNGIIELPDIKYLEVRNENGVVIAKKGRKQLKNVLYKQYQLTFMHRGKKLGVGELSVQATLNNVYQRLYDKTIVIAVSQGTKTFMVSIFILFIFQWLVTHHLRVIADYTAKLNFKEKKLHQLKLARKPSSEKDELDQLVLSINNMQDNLSSMYQQLIGSNDILETKVKNRTAELRIKNAELKAFSYSIAHDLRTPLRAIKSFSQILKEELGNDLSPDHKILLNRVIDAAQRQSELIDGILSLSKISRKEIIIENINLSNIANNIAKYLIDLDPERKCNWIIDENLHAKADKALMSILFNNLIENSWKYTLNQESPIIEIGKNIENNEEIFYVKDNGCGFDMNYISKLFKPFSRLHNNTLYEGNGIGLATVKQIVERHNGKIWVESSINHGAIFYFSLNNFK